MSPPRANPPEQEEHGPPGPPAGPEAGEVGAGGTYRLDRAELRRDCPAWLVLAAGLVAAALAYPHLPEAVPIHFDIQGRPDRYAGRLVGAFGLPLLNVAVYGLMLVVPLVDPGRANYPRFAGFYRGLRVMMAWMLAALEAVVLSVGLGRPVDVGLVTLGAVSLLLLYTGNSLGRVRFNYFVGIRTPWTLASERVWRRTHRVGGRLLVAAALLPWAGMLFSRAAAFWLLVAGLGVATVGSMVYSLVLYRREVSA